MKARVWLWGGVSALLLLGLAGFGGWLSTLPPASAGMAAPPLAPGEAEAIPAALHPPKRARPLIAIIGLNRGTETTDYLMPYGILRRADVADVALVAAGPGPVTLYPALAVEPDATTAGFDRQHPEGADYVIVPAMRRDDDPAVLRWVRAQAATGAIVIGVCAGAKVVAAAGLLDGRRATTHWYYLKELREKHPTIRYVPNRRLVVDRGVATTTGVSASMPLSLTLIEAIAGRAKADAVARGLGLAKWDTRHRSDAFGITRPFALTVMGNLAAFWDGERIAVPLEANVDQVSLALVSDAWSRTYRSRVQTVAPSASPVRTRNGARVLPDKQARNADTLISVGDRPPVRALDHALRAIGARYGPHTRDVVAMQLEYPS